MRYRTLGRTGFKVSEIGFGTWGLGGDAYGPIDDCQARECLAAALDRGINFFDTSDLYGAGRSETLLGSALRGARENAIIATKAGLLPHSGFTMPQDLSPTHLRQALEASLRRLVTDHVELYLLHSPDLSSLRANTEIFETLEELRDAGKVRALGLSARSPADALEALALFDFDAVEVNFNLIDHRAAESDLFVETQRRD
ncbi:MAG: aldo/keto reductase, partial [Vulcanimicrobiaceae bacterium]